MSAAESQVIREQNIWNKLGEFGLNDYAKAAVMGHLFAESGLLANNLQNTSNKRLGMTDEQYTTAVDNGTYTNFVHDKAGYGLCQWTYWSRKQDLLNYAKSTGRSIGDECMQIEFFWKEIQGYRKVKEALLSAISIRQVSDILLHDFEQPANQSVAVEELRASYGQKYYDKYAGTTIVSPESPVASTPSKNYKLGWSEDSFGWWYADTTETYYENCWQNINGHRYYFNNLGYAVTGWHEIDGKKYFFEDTVGHDLECALYVSDDNGAQSIGTF